MGHIENYFSGDFTTTKLNKIYEHGQLLSSFQTRSNFIIFYTKTYMFNDKFVELIKINNVFEIRKLKINRNLSKQFLNYINLTRI